MLSLQAILLQTNGHEFEGENRRYCQLPPVIGGAGRKYLKTISPINSQLIDIGFGKKCHLELGRLHTAKFSIFVLLKSI